MSADNELDVLPNVTQVELLARITARQILTSCSELVLVFARVSHSLTHKTFNLHQSELSHLLGKLLIGQITSRAA